MGNYHYIVFWVSIVYFLIPNKIPTIQSLIFLVYFFAGLLKLNFEWLSGSSLANLPTYFSGYFLEVSTAFVVVLELFVSFFLLSKNSFIKYFALFLILIFHISSWKIVSFYYPSIMILLLSIFVFPDVFKWRLRQLFKFNPENFPGLALLVLFCGLQFIPRLLSNNPEINGEGRIWALNMFDAYTQCQNHTYFRKSKNVLIEAHFQFPNFGRRIKCDPMTYWSHANYLCHKISDEKTDFNSYLVSKKFSQEKFTPIFNISNFCTKKPKYNIYGRNIWVN